jgi:long-chain acyl-CoA synthetase
MLFETFKRLRNETPDAPAFLITSGDRSLPITWRQFTDDIDAIAWVVRNHSQGRSIALLGENSYEWITGHAACLFTGACVVPIDVNLTAAEIAERLEFTDAIALVYSSLHAEKAQEVRKLAPAVVFAGFGTDTTDSFIERGRQAAAGGDSIWPGEGPGREGEDGRPRTATLVFTSGTTSVPRGAELTLEGIEAFVAYAAAMLPTKPGQRSLMLLPLHHIFGICATYFMLSRGVALGICPDFRRIHDAAVRFRIDFVFLVPALADILAAKMEQHRGPDLEWVLVGGAPLSPRTGTRLRSLGVKALTGYGLTETSALYSIAPLEGDPHAGSAGKACTMPGVETKVSPEGELLIRGPNVMKGYFRAPEQTAAVLSKDGWFRTGDMGSIDGDGFVWVKGRGSRTIVLSSGKKIAPEELEEKLLVSPGVREVVVYGEGESRTVTAEIFSDLPETEVRAIVAAVNQTLPVYKRIKRVVARRTPFPRTSSGKICYARKPVRTKRRRRGMEQNWSLILLAALGILALVSAIVSVMPNFLESQGVLLPPVVKSVFSAFDIIGEVLLVVFACLFIFRLRRR